MTIQKTRLTGGISKTMAVLIATSSLLGPTAVTAAWSFDDLTKGAGDMFDSAKGAFDGGNDGNAESGEPTLSRTTLQGCAAGGVTAALLDKFDFLGDGNPLLKVGIGTLVGCAAGELLNQRRDEYANKADFYDAQIEQSEKNNESLAKFNDEVEKEIVRNKGIIKGLKSQKTRSSAAKKKAKESHARTKANAEIAEKELALARKEAETQNEVLKEMRAVPAPKADAGRIRDLQAEVDTLNSHVSDLEAMVAEIADQRDVIGTYG
ncbi:MAG: hypothetical protein OI74_08455 [Gammaproteobacteria bacterium (ex Lamellibrachia satsuma)]|nr:MAG: hypothetical protein HPY30_10855 [Gammaproteobacteria bacterium (ex Lamellibrachia satsuma)]RRS33122.1 MAG: hypothetical protein OI74_08455 [Gammaproteobacteria bacterium (ex Lamellibrachia satsuma)]RRS36266.1 MAG: hypothetical protein NV67_07245 [Gammaproteobacteria bacterium (ex Lamellibrachia satsuma)]